MSEYNTKHGKISRVFSWVLMVMLMLGAFQLVDQNANYYQASVLQEPSVPAFNGTVPPIKSVPNWVALKSDEWGKKFSLITKRIPLPLYDVSVLSTPTANLKWGNAAHDTIRNSKITFSTPYLGNYKLDGQENVGSHLAVDIKTAEGTPVYAIMNGLVTKSLNQSSGFGNHIVIKHPKVPSLNSASKTETLYSSYSHLSSRSVNTNTVVKKGQLIGYVGDSGTATTDHLHFQLDNAKAPWHPYWAFTGKDARDAGVSFWEAVNIGLGMSDAKLKTVHPMMYVQKYQDGAVFASSREDSNTSSTVIIDDVPEVIKTAGKLDIGSSDFDLKFTVRSSYDIEDGEIVVTIRQFHANGDIFRDVFPGSVKLRMENNKTRISPSVLSAPDFVKGRTKIKLKSLDAGNTRLIAEYDGNKFYSPKFDLRETVVVSDEISSEDSGKNDFFSDVSASDESYNAIKYLYQQGIISGYDDGTFKPDNFVGRVEALKIVTEALIRKDLRVENPSKLPFSDTVVGVWYSGYVATAYSNGLVNGYPDKTFRPAQQVNRAEFAKIALTAAKAKFPTTIDEDPYKDVPKDAWFSPFIAYAKDKNILNEKRSKIHPANPMTRREVSEFMFRILVIEELGTGKYVKRLDTEMRGL